MDLRLFGTETIEEASRRQLDSELAAAIEDQPCRTKATTGFALERPANQVCQANAWGKYERRSKH